MYNFHKHKKYGCVFAKNGSIYSTLSLRLSSFISIQLDILQRLRDNKTQYNLLFLTYF